jgi:hypothetical protein
MNYRKNYIDIINNAKKQKRNKQDGYYELHHILPKSLFPLWKKRKSNKVLLTSREHYLVHYLLCKIYNKPEMFYAFWFMNNNGKYKILSSNTYKKLKIKQAEQKKKDIAGINSKTRREIICIETGEIFFSITEAQKQKNIKYIAGALRKEQNMSGGYHWDYYDKNKKYNLDDYLKRDMIKKENTIKKIKDRLSNKKNHPMYGKKHSKESKEKMKKNNKRSWLGKKHTEEEKEKISLANKEKIVTEETRKKISESCKGRIPYNKGIPATEEQKRKQSIIMKGRKISEEHKEKIKFSPESIQKAKEINSKKIICIETGEIFDSIISAANFTNVSTSAISNMLRGKTKKAGGYSWIYTTA